MVSYSSYSREAEVAAALTQRYNGTRKHVRNHADVTNSHTVRSRPASVGKAVRGQEYITGCRVLWERHLWLTAKRADDYDTTTLSLNAHLTESTLLFSLSHGNEWIQLWSHGKRGMYKQEVVSFSFPFRRQCLKMITLLLMSFGIQIIPETSFFINCHL